MTNPLKHVRALGGFSEAYHVVRTAVVVLDGHTYRIEVLKGHIPATAAYTARCAVLRPVPAPALAPADAPPDGRVTVWVEYPFASPVAGDRPKEALAEALSRLTAQSAAGAGSPPRPRRRAPVAASPKAR
jgi:hypothetical protein